jgi:hypothetical protein
MCSFDMWEFASWPVQCQGPRKGTWAGFGWLWMSLRELPLCALRGAPGPKISKELGFGGARGRAQRAVKRLPKNLLRLGRPPQSRLGTRELEARLPCDFNISLAGCHCKLAQAYLLVSCCVNSASRIRELCQ